MGITLWWEDIWANIGDGLLCFVGTFLFFSFGWELIVGNLKMAPNWSRQNSSGSFDHTRFLSADAVAGHASSFVNKIAIPEQGLDQGLTTHFDVQPMIDGCHWQKFCALPATVSILSVREFYANSVEATNDFVFVRGKLVPFLSHAINEFYETLDIENNGYG